MSSSSRRIALWGAYGIGNTGDELTLVSSIDRLRGENNIIEAICLNVDLLRWIHTDVQAVQYQNPIKNNNSLFERIKSKINFGYKTPSQKWRKIVKKLEIKGTPAWLNSIKDSDYLYLVGGGYLTDTFNLDEMMIPIVAANVFGKPIFSAPIGIGPFHLEAYEKSVAIELSKANLLSRDINTQKFCEKYSIDSKFQNDDVVNIKKVPLENWCSHNEALKKNDGEILVGVNFNIQPGADYGGDYIEAYAALINKLRRLCDNLRFFGFCFFRHEKELEITSSVFLRAGLNPRDVFPVDLDFKKNVGMIKGSDLIISTRFHALVLGQVFDIPCLGIWSGKYYKQKIEAVNSYNPGLINSIPVCVLERDAELETMLDQVLKLVVNKKTH